MMERYLPALRSLFAPLQVPMALSGASVRQLPCLRLPLSLPPHGEAAHIAPILWFPLAEGTVDAAQWTARLSRLIPPGGVKIAQGSAGLFIARDTPFLTLLPDPDDPLVMGLRLGLILRGY